MTENFFEKYKYSIVTLATITAVLAAAGLYFFNYYLGFNPFVRSYQLQLVLNVNADKDGKLWLIDDESKRLTRINSQMEADRIIYSGNLFESCDQVCSDDNGGIYIVNIYIKGLQQRYHEQQILHLDGDGRLLGVIYSTDYDKDRGDNRIRGMRVAAGKLYFAEINKSRVTWYSYDEFSGKLNNFGTHSLLNRHWSSVVCDAANKRLVVAYKSGELMEYTSFGERQLPADNRNYIPIGLKIDNSGNILFFDAVSKSVMSFSKDKPVTVIGAARLEQAYGSDFAFVNALSVMDSRTYVVALNQLAVFYPNGHYAHIERVGISSRIVFFSFLAWLSLLLLVLAALLLLIILYFTMFRRISGKAVQPLLLGLVPIVVATVFIISTINADNSASRFADSENRVKHLSRFIGETTDSVTLKDAYGGNSYSTPAYLRLEQTISNIAKSGNANDSNFYSAFYYCDAGKLYCILDSTDDFVRNYQLPRLPEYEYIFNAFEKNEPASMKVSDREGGWLCSAYPVRDGAGKVTGVVEVDCETAYIDFVNHGDILFSLLKLISLLYVAFLLTYELSVFINAKQSAAAENTDMRKSLHSTRAVAFITFFCLRMVYGFMPLFVSRYQLADYGISYELAVGIAFSLEYITVLFINSFAGFLASRIGWKPLTCTGLCLSGLSALISFYASSLAVFYIGQIFMGFAVNIAYCGIDTRLGSEPDEERRALFRPEQMAGIYSGSLCGLLVGLWLFERVSAAAAVWTLTGLAAILTIFFVLVMKNRCDLTSATESGRNIFIALRVIFKDVDARQFFLFILLPSTVLIAEPLYIIQMFVTQNGYSVMNIGWGEMAAEFAIVYFGSKLFSISMRCFSLKVVSIIGSSLLVIGHLLAAAGYSLLYMYAGMLIVSFGYAVIHSSFPEYCLTFDSTKIVGRQTMAAVYELILSACYAIGYCLLGQLFGTIGLQRGWLITACLAAGFFLLFLFPKFRSLSGKAACDRKLADSMKMK